MNEKLQYASMLEIPVSTCSVTVKDGKSRKKKRKRADTEAVKNKLIAKVNAVEEKSHEEFLPSDNDIINEQEIQEIAPEKTVKEKRKKKFSFSVIGVQIAVIGALIATIFLTNAFYPESGLNTFFKGVFSTEQVEVLEDERTYKDFAPVLALSEGTVVNVDGGVINFDGESSVYSPCDGKVLSVIKGEDGKFSVEIEHGKNFSTTVSGLDYAYCEVGQQVFSNIPVGYAGESAKMCFFGTDDAVISDYRIDGNSVIWAV